MENSLCVFDKVSKFLAKVSVLMLLIQKYYSCLALHLYFLWKCITARRVVSRKKFELHFVWLDQYTNTYMSLVQKKQSCHPCILINLIRKTILLSSDPASTNMFSPEGSGTWKD